MKKACSVILKKEKKTTIDIENVETCIWEWNTCMRRITFTFKLENISLVLWICLVLYFIFLIDLVQTLDIPLMEEGIRLCILCSYLLKTKCSVCTDICLSYVFMQQGPMPRMQLSLVEHYHESLSKIKRKV